MSPQTDTRNIAVKKTVTVQATQERAFTVFTEQVGSWWPPEHHIGTADLADAFIEPRVGGRFYERGTDGSECDWGQVLLYEPPSRVLLSWNLQGDWTYDPDLAKASEVEVRFIAEGPRTTRVELEHRHIERHGEGAEGIREAVDGENGWPVQLRRFAVLIRAA